MELKRIDISIFFSEVVDREIDFGKMFFASNPDSGLLIYEGDRPELEVAVRYAIKYGTWSSVIIPMNDEFDDFIRSCGQDPAEYLLIQYYQLSKRSDLVQTFIAVRRDVFESIYKNQEEQ